MPKFSTERIDTLERAPQTFEQLEFPIGLRSVKCPPTSRRYNFLIDPSLRLLGCDPSTAHILGISTEGGENLSGISRLSEEERASLAGAVESLLAEDTPKGPLFQRIEISQPHRPRRPYLLSLHRISRDRVSCLVEEVEPLENVRRAPRLFTQNGLLVWGYCPTRKLFTAHPSLEELSRGSATLWEQDLESWARRIAPQDRERFRSLFEAFIEGAFESFHLRYRVTEDHQSYSWITTIARRKGGPSGEIVGLHRDESEIPAIDDDFRLFSYLAKKVHLPIVVCDTNGCIDWCNAAFSQLTGYAVEEALGRRPGSFLQGPQTDPSVVAYMSENLRTQRSFTAELVNYRKDGSPYWVRIDAHPFVDESGQTTRFVAFQTDISAIKRAKEQEKSQGIDFPALFKDSKDAVLFVSPLDGCIMESNPEAIRILGAKHLVGKRLEDLFPESPLFRNDHLAKLCRVPGSHRECGEFTTASGETRPVEMSASKTLYAGEQVYFVSFRDISARRMLEEQLRRAQRMEAVGRLSGSVAHDFNNLLAGLRGFCELLSQSGNLSEQDLNYAREMIKITDRAQKLTSRLLSFSRGKSDRPIVVDLNELVGNLSPMLSRVLKKDIEFTSTLAKKVGNVRVDPAQIEQVIMNLVVNGQEAITSREGRVEISSGEIELDGSEFFITGKPKPGRYVRLSVADNGQGIPADVLEKIFEPFFTTKKGTGTGLGLSIVYGIVQSNEGHLMVESAPSMGTNFDLYFPIVDEPIARAEEPDLAEALPPASGPSNRVPTLLIAEDEEQVREILQIGLGQNGYRLIVASNGKEAMDLAEMHKGKIDLLLTDSIMPKAHGREVAKRARELHPDIRVIMMSGLPQSEEENAGGMQHIDAYVDKPFSIRKLMKLIDKLLNVEAVT